MSTITMTTAIQLLLKTAINVVVGFGFLLLLDFHGSHFILSGLIFIGRYLMVSALMFIGMILFFTTLVLLVQRLLGNQEFAWWHKAVFPPMILLVSSALYLSNELVVGGALLLFGMVVFTNRHQRQFLEWGGAVLFVGIVLLAHEPVSFLYPEGGMRQYALRTVAERSTPLIEAINRFQKVKDRTPNSIDELIPKFISTIPWTGLLFCPTYKFHVVPHNLQRNVYRLDELDSSFALHQPWSLTVLCGRSLLDDNFYAFHPTDSYPYYKSWGDRKTILGWVFIRG